MMYPLVRELAADGIPVTVTSRVLEIARQPYYRGLAHPVTDAELTAAYRANALFDAHREDPELGCRILVDEARDAGEAMADRTACKLCSQRGWWSAFGKKSGRNAKTPGPPVHDDLVARDFTAPAPNRLWLSDITEHWTGEGKLYLCAVKDVDSNRIVGYSIDSRMKSSRQALKPPKHKVEVERSRRLARHAVDAGVTATGLRLTTRWQRQRRPELALEARTTTALHMADAISHMGVTRQDRSQVCAAPTAACRSISAARRVRATGSTVKGSSANGSGAG